jgi:hypothetical protein
LPDDLIVRQIHTSLESSQSLAAITCKNWIHPLEEAIKVAESKRIRQEQMRRWYGKSRERLRRFRERRRIQKLAGLK